MMKPNTQTKMMQPKERAATLRDFLARPDVMNRLAGVVAGGLIPKRCMAVAMTACLRQPKLLGCTGYSIAGAVVQAAELGWEVDPLMGLAYLVPFKNRHTRALEAQLIPGYRGLMQLARESEQIGPITANVVFANDLFEFEEGSKPFLKHIPWWKVGAESSGEIIAAYAVATWLGPHANGLVQFKVVPRTEIDATRRRSQASTEGPWVTDFDAMCRKTAVKRLVPFLPHAIKLQKAVTLDNLAENALPQHLESIMDIPAGEVEPEEPVEDMDKHEPQQADMMAVADADHEDEPEPEPPAG